MCSSANLFNQSTSSVEGPWGIMPLTWEILKEEKNILCFPGICYSMPEKEEIQYNKEIHHEEFNTHRSYRLGNHKC